MLTNKQKNQLRALSHKYKPVVMVGSAGLTENVISAVDEALTAHELIKVKITVGDRDTRDEAIRGLLSSSSAELVSRIGNIATIYRRNNDNPRVQV